MKDLSLYIHIPFCKNICLYCNFLTFANKSAWIPQYVAALGREIEERGRTFGEYTVETIYFGGGTPSLIDPLLIKKIIQSAKASFKVKPRTEITIECNPESADAARLKIYREAGITRFSLGVQSLNKKTLARVARPHDAAAIFRALQRFQKAGIENFGADFIMGLPGQSLDSFQQEIEAILKFGPSHFSCYFLSYDTKKIDLFIKDCPPEDEQIRMYHWVCKRLKKAGFSHYEVSNWARRGFECKHNKRYWEQKDYLGVGLGAHSIVEKRMWENQKNFEGYLRNPLATANETLMDNDLMRMEQIMLGMRTKKGLSTGRYRAAGDLSELMKIAQPFLQSGHLKKSRGRLACTEKGFLIADAITEKLL